MVYKITGTMSKERSKTGDSGDPLESTRRLRKPTAPPRRVERPVTDYDRKRAPDEIREGAEEASDDVAETED